MYQGVIIAGFGGQGVVSAGIVLACSGMLENKYVTFFPSYGAEMRGGTANCSVVISTNEVASPLVTNPDSLIVMNEPSLVAFEPKLKKGGVLFINSSLIEKKPKRSDIEIVNIPANNLAEEVGNIKIANMVIVGAYCRKTGAIGLEAVYKAIPKVFPRASGEMVKMNIAAIKKGAEAVYFFI